MMVGDREQIIAQTLSRRDWCVYARGRRSGISINAVLGKPLASFTAVSENRLPSNSSTTLAENW